MVPFPVRRHAESRAQFTYADKKRRRGSEFQFIRQRGNADMTSPLEGRGEPKKANKGIDRLVSEKHILQLTVIRSLQLQLIRLRSVIVKGNEIFSGVI